MDRLVKQHAIRALAHIRQFGVDDVFQPPLFHRPIERELLSDRDYRTNIIKNVEGFLKANNVRSVSSPIRFNIPKSRYAYRAASWLELTDATAFLALVLLESSTIEAARISVNEKCIMSYRMRPHGAVFNKSYTYASFRERSNELSNSGAYKVKVNTDIANFYDRVNLHRLESILASIGCSSRNISKINDLLLIWAGRNSYGLPVGCDASRILAEACLINVDRELVRRDIRFVRFVDDYRIFATNFMEANRNLNYLIDALDKEGLFLNTSKTAMIDLTQKDGAAIEEEEPNENRGKGESQEFEAIDTKTRIEHLVRVQGRYSTRIVKTYRSPGEEQIKLYQKMDMTALKAELANSIDVSEDNIRNFVKAFIYRKGTRSVEDLCEVIEKHIHYVPYIVDALIKESSRIKKDERNKIRDFFAGILNGDQCTEYYKIAAFRLCSDPKYDGLGVCRDFIEGMPIALSPITQREVILRMAELSDRSTLVSLRSRYNHFSLPARRAIFYCWKTTEHVLDAERRAFMRTLNKTESDTLISREAGKMSSTSRKNT